MDKNHCLSQSESIFHSLHVAKKINSLGKAIQKLSGFFVLRLGRNFEFLQGFFAWDFSSLKSISKNKSIHYFKAGFLMNSCWLTLWLSPPFLFCVSSNSLAQNIYETVIVPECTIFGWQTVKELKSICLAVLENNNTSTSLM